MPGLVEMKDQFLVLPRPREQDGATGLGQFQEQWEEGELSRL